MITVRFIKDGSEGITSKYRYKKGEKVTLPESILREAIQEGLVEVLSGPRKEFQTSQGANQALDWARRRDS